MINFDPVKFEEIYDDPINYDNKKFKTAFRYSPETLEYFRKMQRADPYDFDVISPVQQSENKPHS